MRIVCGLDVHKDSIYLCILSSTGEILEQVFGVLTTQLEEMRDLMLKYNVQEVGMESTSVYWIPVWRVLESHFELKLINPYFIKQLPGRKSDVKDAQWIAECMMKELVRGSFVPPERIQQLRLYDRRIYDLDDEIIRKLAKLDAVIQRCNIRPRLFHLGMLVFFNFSYISPFPMLCRNVVWKSLNLFLNLWKTIN